MANLEVEINRLPNTLIVRGKYTIEITLSLNTINKEESFLKDAEQKFRTTCKELEEKITSIKYMRATQHLRGTLEEIYNKGNFIKTYFNIRERKRSIWSALGAMDSNDRIRLDYDMDQLSGNEEKLKNDLIHQANVLQSTYNLVNTSVLNMDTHLMAMKNKVEKLKFEVVKYANFTQNIENIINLETRLLEMGLWLNSLSSKLEKKLDTLVAALTQHTSANNILRGLVPPGALIDKLKLLETTIDGGLSFPHDKDGRITIDMLNNINYEHELIDKEQINFKFYVPLVGTEYFETRRVAIMPQLTNFTVLIRHIEENIVMFKYESDWGYTLTSDEYTKCTKLKGVTICDISTAQENLKRAQKCATGIILEKNTVRCQAKAVVTNHTMWFATRSRNNWKYLAPMKTNITIEINGNMTQQTVDGAGIIRLTPHMVVHTDFIRLEYYETNYEWDTNVTLLPDNINRIETQDVDLREVPIWNGIEKVYSYINQKTLFDLGVDVKDIKTKGYGLKNLIYAPLENPWTSIPVVIGITTTFIIILCLYKGRISCCARRTTIEN
ncbi:uncharacterized protein LOC129732089 isoform X2 [Wyeomyia smithii]|uniref:uncharacterized protein LOC129732089 isoform X2 n=1 Tax=Wyeomyia smithii TaxID=174621 RepID=UPI002467EC23|nr:uncharacterized protein LOC129732089 isoform X2 [Wyeomyia smithii]XP_055548579.1 uncharacterized protein LOC129732089 isoform X2 [Wyeomyia smithii]XP_055548580.1 uncharacterized protein LOC129732089 isoform X2 [Wyeomyia smithii]